MLYHAIVCPISEYYVNYGPIPERAVALIELANYEQEPEEL
jgi:hypothetical protein